MSTSDQPGSASEHTGFSAIAELVIDIAREIQVRAAMQTPLVPLTQTQGQVMRYVHRHPGCSASDIADGSGLHRTNVSTTLRELRSRGYVTSHRDADDGRAIRIHATVLADENIATLRASWAALVADAWAVRGPGGDDIPDDVIVTLARIRDGLGAARTDRADRARKAFPPDSPADAERIADSESTADERVPVRG